MHHYDIHENPFQGIQNLIFDNPTLQDSWKKIIEANLKPDGYIFNVIFSALYFLDNNKSLADIIKFAGKANYSPIIYSVINACIHN